MFAYKKIIIVLVFCFFSIKHVAQVYRFKAVSFSVMEKLSKDKWGEWAEFEPSTTIISIDNPAYRSFANQAPYERIVPIS